MEQTGHKLIIDAGTQRPLRNPVYFYEKSDT